MYPEERAINQRCTNPRYQVTMVTKFCMVVQSVVDSQYGTAFMSSPSV